MIKALKKLRMKGKYLNIIKAMYDTHSPNIILSRDKLKSSSLKLRMKEEGWDIAWWHSTHLS
jgi:hypothetical protein